MKISESTISPHIELLEEWRQSVARLLDDFREDLDDDAHLLDDRLTVDFNRLRHMMGRRDVIVNEIMRANGPHRGPGTPGYPKIGGL